MGRADSLYGGGIACDDAAEGAAVGLLGMMTGISEETWCAGWMSGLEYELWDACSGGGRQRLTDRQAQLLRLLAEEADGWWVWSASDARPRLMSLAEWKGHLASRTTETRAFDSSPL